MISFIMINGQSFAEMSVKCCFFDQFISMSGLNATGKTPMYEIPLIYIGVGVCGWASIFCIGVFGYGILSLVFFSEIVHFAVLCSSLYYDGEVVIATNHTCKRCILRENVKLCSLSCFRLIKP